MKKISILLIIVLLALFSFACQQTPKEPIIINKGTDALESSLKNPEPTARYQAPPTLKDDFKSESLEVIFDSEVNIPDVERYPVLKIKLAEFTQQQVDTAAAYLMQGKPLINNQRKKTKKELEEEYIKYKALVNDVKRYPHKYDMPLEYYEANIKKLEDQIKNASDVVTEEITDSTLKPGPENSTMLSVMADLGNSEPAKFYILNNAGIGALIFKNGIQYKDVSMSFPELINATPTDISMSKEDALKLACQTVQGIGAKDMNLAAYTVGVVTNKGLEDNLEDYKKQCHMFYFTRTADGIGSFYTGKFAPAVGDSTYNQTSPYEIIKVCIDDTGLSYLEWNGNSEVIGYETENVSLLPFDKIIEIAKQQFKSTYLWNEDHLSCSIKISNVTLGLMTVVQRNNNEYNLLVPVWNFFGAVSYDEGDYKDMGFQSLLEINGIDGSNINTELGY